jgi:flagellar M-ring protein FliF
MVVAGTEARAMNQLRQMLANVQQWVGGVSAASKLTVALVAIILGLVLFVVYQSSSKQTWVELYPGLAGEQATSMQSHLVSRGFDTRLEAGKLMVRPDMQAAAKASVGEANLLPSDKAILFENVLRQQNWTFTRQQNEALYNEALQNELEKTIGGFANVKKAEVFIEVPPPMGLGQSVRRPTAAVSVLTKDGSALPQRTVDAVASLVAGAKAGLTLDMVRVIDAATGRQLRARSDSDSASATYMEHAAKVEQLTREKLQELLGYIPGVVIAVTAQVDVTRVETQLNEMLRVGAGSVSLPTNEETTETVSEEGGNAPAQPGVMSNQTADINTAFGSGKGNRNTSTQTSNQTENHVGSRVQRTVDPRGFPTQVAVSVAVPEGFVSELLKQESAGQESAGQGSAAGGGGAAAGTAQGPTAQQIRDAFDQRIKPAILESIKPQVRAMTSLGSTANEEQLAKAVEQSISVAMIPLGLRIAGNGAVGTIGVGGAAMGASAGGGGLAGSLGGMSGLIEKGVLVLLACAAMGMMFMLVKKGGASPNQPTAEELVGLPPALDGETDIVGEADESEQAMTGIEVPPDKLETQKMLEQVSAMLDENPENVAKLLNRWIRTDD